MHSCTIRQVHFISGLYVKGLVEFRDVREWAVYAVLCRSVYIGEELGGYALGALFEQPAKGVAKEEAL